jgi:23S rRNA pseudouridine1911/1915/1917 synthase
VTLRRYDLSCTVDPYRGGWTLVRFLEHRFRYYPSDVWAARIAEGAVRVNGTVAPASRVVQRGDVVTYALWHEEPEVDFSFDVLHEDAHVLAVSKSGNLPVHAGGKFIRNTLIAELRASRGPELRLAHRLDRETSGVVLLAKSREAARALEREFHLRRVHKEYVAIVQGTAPREVLVDAPIAREASAGGPIRRVVDVDGGKPARTLFRRVAVRVAGPREAAAGDVREGPPGFGAISLVLAVPETGRTNQIRVHACHAGHPVLGDKIYGESAAQSVVPSPTEGHPLRQMLHCRRLVVRHPAEPRALDVAADPPADFAAAWGGPLPPFEVSWPGIDPLPPGDRSPGSPR